MPIPRLLERNPPPETGRLAPEELKYLGPRFEALMEAKQGLNRGDYPINVHYPGGPDIKSNFGYQGEAYKRNLQRLDFEDLMAKRPNTMLDFSDLLLGEDRFPKRKK